MSEGTGHLYLAPTRTIWMFLLFISLDIWHQTQGVQKVEQTQSLHMVPCREHTLILLTDSFNKSLSNLPVKSWNDHRVKSASRCCVKRWTTTRGSLPRCCNAASWTPSLTWWRLGCSHWKPPAGEDRDTLRSSWQLHRRSRGSTRKQNNLNNIKRFTCDSEERRTQRQ